MSTEQTRASKEIMTENIINCILMVNEGKLDKVSDNQVHLVTKGFLQVCSVNRAFDG